MIRMPRFRWATAVLAMGVLAVAACDDDDDDGGPTNEGTLEVTVTATGTPADPDGFTVLLDGTQMGALAPATGGVRTQDLEPGDYEVELDNLADNCTVDGDNPRTVTIEDDETTEGGSMTTPAPPVTEHDDFERRLGELLEREKAHTREGDAPPGTDSRSSVRLGARYTIGSVRADAALLIGITARDALTSLTLASKELAVTPKQLQGLVIRKR